MPSQSEQHNEPEEHSSRSLSPVDVATFDEFHTQVAPLVGVSNKNTPGGPNTREQELLNLINRNNAPSKDHKPTSKNYRGGRPGALEATHDERLEEARQFRRYKPIQRHYVVAHPNTPLDFYPQRPTLIPIDSPKSQRVASRNSKGSQSVPFEQITPPVSEANWMLDWQFDSVSANTSKEQAKLLQQSYSWHKPAPGIGAPDGSIPINIFKEISQVAEENMTAQDRNEARNVDDADRRLDPDRNMGINAESDSEDDPAFSMVSWSVTPSPQAPKMQSYANLPPDSSCEDQQPSPIKNMANGESGLSAPMRHANVKSINGNNLGDLLSSPLNPIMIGDSDDEMEVDIPHGLGEDQMSGQATPGPKPKNFPSSTSVLSQTKPIVQVMETPYSKQRNPKHLAKHNTPSATPEQSSSSTSKDVPSMTIIHGTYGHGQAGRSKPSPPSAQLEPEEQIPITGPFSSKLHDTYAIHCFDALEDEARNELAMKRKSETSPSKSNLRQAKRREIKIVGFGGLSPDPQHHERDFQEERKEAMQRYRESRASKPVSVIPSPMRNFLDSEPQTASHSEVPPAPTCNEQSRTKSAQKIGVARNLAPSPRDEAPGIESYVSSPSTPVQPYEGAQLAYRFATPEKKPVVKVGNYLDEKPDFVLSLATDPKTTPIFGTQTPFITVFDEFKAAYPEYTGNFNHFIKLCREMSSLDQEDKMIPKWMWDDYLIRNRTDYTDYILQCADANEKHEPYHRFYKNHIRDTTYDKGILKDRATLEKALEEFRNTGNQSMPAGPSTKREDRSRRAIPWSTSNAGRRQSGNTGQYGDQSSATTTARSGQVTPGVFREPPTKSPLFANLEATNYPVRQTTNLKLDQNHNPESPVAGLTNGRGGPRTSSTGNPFRDFVLAQGRMTSLTGSTKRTEGID